MLVSESKTDPDLQDLNQAIHRTPEFPYPTVDRILNSSPFLETIERCCDGKYGNVHSLMYSSAPALSGKKFFHVHYTMEFTRSALLLISNLLKGLSGYLIPVYT